MKHKDFEVFTVDNYSKAVTYAKSIYCRYFTILCYPQIAIQSELCDCLIKCKRSEYSIVGIKHVDSSTEHFHFVIGFTSSYNQKKCIYQIIHELGLSYYFDCCEEFVDLVNHIRPVSRIKDTLLYLTHSSKVAIQEHKKPYSVGECFAAVNGNSVLFDRLNDYMSFVNTIDDVEWSISDAGRYLYNLVLTYQFRDQYELQKYVVFDTTITDSQRNKVLSNWRNFIFAIQREFTVNSRKFALVDKETFQNMEKYILSMKGDLNL